jgi:acyl-coenzyme A synthetase/AMP-(fatty) acid ligase
VRWCWPVSAARTLKPGPAAPGAWFLRWGKHRREVPWGALPGYRVEAVEVKDGVVQLLPRGEIGRLVVRGPTGLTYWNLPDMQRCDAIDD